MALVNVFITNLGKYNEGELIGEWLELPTDEEEIEKALKRIGVAPNTDYEESFITDTESDYGISVGEYTPIYSLNRLLNELMELSGDNENLIGAINEVEDDLNRVKEVLESGDYNFYEGQSIDDIADELFRDKLLCCGMDRSCIDDIMNYINIDSYAEELTDGTYNDTSYGVIDIFG